MSSLLFVHGAGADHTVWRFQTRRSERLGFTVVAPDLPGHGSNPEAGMDDIAGYAAWLKDLMTPTESVTLVGHSMGGLIGLELAATGPEFVARLVLVGTAPRMMVHDDLVLSASSDLGRAADLIAGWSVPGTFRGGHPEPGTWQRGAGRRLVASSRPGVLAGDLTACIGFDGRSLMSQIAVPTLVISGSEDRMVPPTASRALADGIEGAEFVLMDGSGHEPMIQQPREFNSVLERWLGADGMTPSR